MKTSYIGDESGYICAVFLFLSTSTESWGNFHRIQEIITAKLRHLFQLGKSDLFLSILFQMRIAQTFGLKMKTS